MIKTVSKNDKETGDLLEKVAKEFLETQGYKVAEQLRQTGVELDLVCGHTNTGKKIYVECKNRKEAVAASVITQLVGTLQIKKQYQEAWLVTTSNLTKDAKGLVAEFEELQKSKFPIYTPEKLLEALTNAKVILDPLISRQKIRGLVKKEKFVRKHDLVITKRGYYYAFEIHVSSKSSGYIFTNATTSDIIDDKDEILFLSDSDSFRDFKCDLVFDFLGDSSEIALTCPSHIELSRDYITAIHDIGMRIVHSNKETLDLNDVFVYPYLEAMEDEEKEKFRSNELGKIDAHHKKCIIFGEDLSGKTTLAKIIQKDLNGQKLTPVYINAEDIRKGDKKSFLNLVTTKFKKQYQPSPHVLRCFGELITEEPNKIPLIIDNYENLGIKLSSSREIFHTDTLSYFSHVLLFANKSLELEMTVDSQLQSQLSNYEKLKLKQLGYLLLDELINKWLIAGDGESMSDDEMYNRTHEISEKVRVAVGTNFVPMYPLYLLTILQLIEATTKSKLQGSSYAELYSFLVNQALGGAKVRAEDLDFYHTYLSYLAYNLFRNQKKIIDDTEFKRIHDEFCEEMDISKKFDEVVFVLCSAKIITMEDDRYKFGHNYSYYFFVAKYFSENSDQGIVKSELDKVFTYLHRIENANIILFLVHHSKDKTLIDRIMSESKSVFSDKQPYALSSAELSALTGLIESQLDFYIKDKDVKEARRKSLEKRDQEKESEAEDETEVKEKSDLDIVGKVTFSFKIIEILGQLMQSYYGSLNGERKQLVLKEVYNLGFRSLYAFLEDYLTFVETLQNEIEEMLASEKSTSSHQKKKMVNKVVSTFAEMIIFVFIKRISDSVTSKDLTITINKVTESMGTPSIRLVQFAVKLNFPDKLDVTDIVALDRSLEGNIIAQRILRHLVAEHFYKFNVDYKLKQMLCEKLDIKYTPAQSSLGIGAPDK